MFHNEHGLPKNDSIPFKVRDKVSTVSGEYETEHPVISGFSVLFCNCDLCCGTCFIVESGKKAQKCVLNFLCIFLIFKL